MSESNWHKGKINSRTLMSLYSAELVKMGPISDQRRDKLARDFSLKFKVANFLRFSGTAIRTQLFEVTFILIHKIFIIAGSKRKLHI